MVKMFDGYVKIDGNSDQVVHLVDDDDETCTDENDDILFPIEVDIELGDSCKSKLKDIGRNTLAGTTSLEQDDERHEQVEENDDGDQEVDEEWTLVDSGLSESRIDGKFDKKSRHPWWQIAGKDPV
ncbi:unnamed protein product [Ambrosiozyma monospora]|uniref:Unnamed protein product n=1 Tax=Ambrosiozyma monospora TaxID=43982 RepID=A0ACB5TT95_AMBMO|nr:unnamed protein product [Ambrosiozyma monospora]